MPIIDVTDDAAQRIRDLLERDGKFESHALRLKVIGGGCSGLRYELTFDDQLRDVDSEINAMGARVVCDEKSALYLAGCTLDFVDTLQESGFKINNPNASATCGCGDSFAA
jgi:iron-sulfur cluster assembly protein